MLLFTIFGSLHFFLGIQDTIWCHFPTPIHIASIHLFCFVIVKSIWFLYIIGLTMLVY